MLDPDDVGVAVPPAVVPATWQSLAGDVAESAELYATARRLGDDRLTWILAVTVANGYTNTGQLDAADAIFDVVRRMLARPRTALRTPHGARS